MVPLPFQLVDHFTTGAAVGTWSHTFNGLSLHLYPFAIALLVIPMGMIRLIKYLLPFSVVANILMSVGTLMLFYFIFTDDGVHDPLRPDEHAKLVVTEITRWTLFAGSALCSMEGVGMVSSIFFYIIFLCRCTPDDTFIDDDKKICVILPFRL